MTAAVHQLGTYDDSPMGAARAAFKVYCTSLAVAQQRPTAVNRAVALAAYARFVAAHTPEAADELVEKVAQRFFPPRAAIMPPASTAS